MRFRARQNLLVDGVLRRVGDVFDSPMTADVAALTAAQLLTQANPDGTFPDPPPPPPASCCGR